ncbi:MAG: M12 family metallo-peptidase [Bryobacterales bacterium]|nr:M12 family metallo-peptidase [Bryobacterales bacterium]
MLSLALLAFIQLGTAGKARAATEQAAETTSKDVVAPSQAPALFLNPAPALAGQPSIIPRAASLARPPDSEDSYRSSDSIKVLRRRSASLDASQLEALREAVVQGHPAHLQLNLFPDSTLQAVIDRTDETRFGYSLSGRIDGQPYSSVTLVVHGKALVGAVQSQEGSYSIRFQNGNIHAISQIAGGLQCGTEGQWTHAASKRDWTLPARRASLETDSSKIDLLVVFTEAARKVEGGLKQMLASIDLAVAYTNDAYEASGVSFRLNLVAAVQVDHQESLERAGAGLLNQNVDMRKMIDANDGFMDGVHALRDHYAADVVHLLVDQVGGGGVGSFLNLSVEDPSARAFSVSNSLSYPNFLAHELGHVMGLRHDRYADRRYLCSACGPDYGGEDNPLPPYNFGYVNQRAFEPGAPKESHWRTIMSYNTQCTDEGLGWCPQIPRFSNPTQKYPDEAGDPLGVPGDEQTDAVHGPADAVRLLNEHQSLIAEFRPSTTRCDYRLLNERHEVPVLGGSFSVRIDTTPSCAWEVSSFEDFLSVTSSTTGTGPGTVSYRVESNDSAARLGYVVVNGETLSVYQSANVPPANVCDRTPQVRDAIVSATGLACDAISEFDLMDVTALDLSRKEITTLDAGDFTGLSNMVDLDLSRNTLGTIPEQAFKDLVNLTKLNLGYTGQTQVPAAIRGMRSLQDLSLRVNSIQTIHKESFKGLSGLRDLDLVGNQITSLADGFLSDLKSLEYLHLLENRLTDLRKEMWEGPLHLVRLDLGRNPLAQIPADVFASIPSVSQIVLRETQLTTVPHEAINGLSIFWLNLADNQISDLSKLEFSGDRIWKLELQNNRIEAIPEDFFDGFTSPACRQANMQLKLEGNPGSPFPVTLTLERIDVSPTATGPASVVVRVREGAPWPIDVPLTVTRAGSLILKRVTIENGATASEPFQVANGDPATLRFADPPRIPGSYEGIQFALGEPLELF